MSIKSLIKTAGLYPYLFYLKNYFLPADNIKKERKLIPARTEFYSMFLNKGDLCFDVGANVGNRTEIFLRLGARVIAIEPQKDCVKILNLRFGNKINIIQKGMAQREGEGIIFMESNHSAIGSMSQNWIQAVKKTRFKSGNWNKQSKIKLTTLDKVIEKYGVPKFCKIDVEGFEAEVLEGLSQPLPYLSFEYTIPERFEEIQKCLGTLSKLGDFQTNYTIDENMQLELTEWIDQHELIKILGQSRNKILFGDIYVRFKNNLD